MNQPRRNNQQQNRRPVKPAALPKPTDLWRPVPQLPEVELIVAAQDPSVLLRSLGDPPLMNKSTVAGHYIATVIERSAALASALAASADLLAKPESTDTD